MGTRSHNWASRPGGARPTRKSDPSGRVEFEDRSVKTRGLPKKQAPRIFAMTLHMQDGSGRLMSAQPIFAPPPNHTALSATLDVGRKTQHLFSVFIAFGAGRILNTPIRPGAGQILNTSFRC